MVKQTTVVTAKHQKEFEMRVKELEARGYKVDQVFEVQENEHHQYSYEMKRQGYKKTHQETDIQKKYSAKMSREI